MTRSTIRVNTQFVGHHLLGCLTTTRTGLAPASPSQLVRTHLHHWLLPTIFADKATQTSPSCSEPALRTCRSRTPRGPDQGASFVATLRRVVPLLVRLVAAGVVWAADGHPALVGGMLRSSLVVNAIHDQSPPW